ncbi:MAG TPA: UDP-N-acetylglucosamine 2-epimerase (non-hydrolyzing) [Bryobacteraceae bacterium]|nr:UDP-N-acetylglucosamine 2-epimerase (non-hydrolyzing) [Bryobacteraceae bacterium]
MTQSGPIKLLCIAGARPNFMKVAPLVRALRREPAFAPLLVHTGQHYDENMSGRFFAELELPPPAYNLEVGSGSHAIQTAEIMKRFEPVVLGEQPQGVIVVGDVNSTAACALVSKKLQIPVAHLEAGLRSFDRAMPEEINRLVTDAISDLLLVTEESGVANLRAEGVPAGRIRLVGNLMIDSLFFHLERAGDSDILGRLGMNGTRYGLVTLHRPSNVDEPERLMEILDALKAIARELPLIFPVHPRTRARLNLSASDLSGILLLDPLGYLDFLCLMSRSAAVFTDSGGIQEETTALGIKCLTLRENTERPTTIELGTNILAGTTRQSILAAWRETSERPKAGRVPPLWDGHAAERCCDALREFFRA